MPATGRRNVEHHGIYKVIDGVQHELCGWDQDGTADDGDDDHVTGWLPAEEGEDRECS